MKIENLTINLDGTSPLVVSALLAGIFAAAPAVAPSKAEPEASPARPPKIGAYWEGQGGIYAGISRGFDKRGDAHLILAIDPASKFEGRSLGTYGVDVKGATSDYDALANTIALAEAGSELCKAIRAVTIDGHSDFALMSRRDAQLCIANLPDEFEKEWHLTSTQASSYDAWLQHVDDGHQSLNHKKFEARARCVRRLFLV